MKIKKKDFIDRVQDACSPCLPLSEEELITFAVVEALYILGDEIDDGNAAGVFKLIKRVYLKS